MTPEEYEAMLQSHGGVCAICGGPGGVRGLAVDHDHKTGQVRGLLCGSCNPALGTFYDDVDLMRRAIAYLAADNMQ